MARAQRPGRGGGVAAIDAASDLARLIPPLLEAARAAGTAILEHYHPGVARSDKADGSPVTAADHAAEAVILSALASLDPATPVLAEEQFAAGKAPKVSTGRFWLVDPLDGTKEFLKGNGEFSVNIGLVENRAPILGVLLAPASGEMFWGCGGRAFTRKGDGPERPIAARAAPKEGLTVAASRSHDSRDKLNAFLAGKKIAAVKATGSAIKFCRVAAGEADLYPRLGPTMEWDSAAGHAILLAAGGSVATLDGGPLLYAKPGFLNPPYVARGR